MPIYSGLLILNEDNSDNSPVAHSIHDAIMDRKTAAQMINEPPKALPFPWHPTLQSQLIGMNINPDIVYRKVMDCQGDVNLDFFPHTNSGGPPVLSDKGVRLPEGHSAITGNNVQLTFDQSSTIATFKKFEDRNEACAIWIAPQALDHFEYDVDEWGDEEGKPMITYIGTKFPDTTLLAVKNLLTERQKKSDPLRFNEIASVFLPGDWSMEVIDLYQASENTIITMLP